jgi:serine/threonine protein kinase
VLDAQDVARDGGMASLRRVRAEGPPTKASTVTSDVVLALKLAKADDPLAVESLGREVETFKALSKAPGLPPCPRLYDVVGAPPTGLVMEWCPTDMERWWADAWKEPNAFGQLCAGLAEVCRRVREYEAVAELDMGRRVIHADIKPRNLLRAADGRWLLTDFGAAKSRSVEDANWAATRMIIGTQNFIAPEALFNARKKHPAAMDTWSLGCTLFALLRVRTHLASGLRMPANGTHSHHFRSHRLALVTDLHQRKPGLFADRDLDPAAFTCPDRMPDKDRAAVAESLRGVFGEPAAEKLESRLVNDVLALLDRALRIDPALRFTDPLEMAGEFEALGTRWRELTLRAGTSGPSQPQSVATPSPDNVQPAQEVVVEESKPAAKAAAARVPPWIGLALLMSLGLQAVQALLTIVLLVIVWRSPGGTVAVEAPEPAPAAVAPAAPATPEAAPAPSEPTQPAVPTPSPEEEAAPAAPAAPTAAAAPAAPTAPATPAAEPTSGTSASPKTSTAAGTSARASTKSTTSTGTAAATGEPGLVMVSGGQAYLLQNGAKRAIGTVPPGSYELWVQPSGTTEFKSQGTITVNSGDRLVWKCGFGTCRQGG